MKFPRLFLLSLAAVAVLSGCGETTEATRATAPTLDTTPPAAPEGLSVMLDATMGTQSLTWGPSPAPDLAGYEVYTYAPDPSRDQSYVLAQQTDATTTTYELTPVGHPTTAYYKVRAVDQLGNKSAFTSYSVQLVPLVGAGDPNFPARHKTP